MVKNLTHRLRELVKFTKHGHSHPSAAAAAVALRGARGREDVLLPGGEDAVGGAAAKVSRAEDAVDEGVGARVGAREQVEELLHAVVHLLVRVLGRPEPAKRVREKMKCRKEVISQTFEVIGISLRFSILTLSFTTAIRYE